uniref:Uncharacterized protein n=1 Tax=Panagrellus redivivus TaxID=6233 RepID=A0A7E4UNL9_PANRE
MCVPSVCGTLKDEGGDPRRTTSKVIRGEQKPRDSRLASGSAHFLAGGTLTVYPEAKRQQAKSARPKKKARGVKQPKSSAGV